VDSLAADDFGRGVLDVAKPNIRIKPHRSLLLAEFSQIGRASIDRLVERDKHRRDPACLHGIEIDDVFFDELRLGCCLDNRLRHHRHCNSDEEEK
jgi:hypothetical protein